MNSSFLNVHTGNGRKRREMEADLRVGITDYDDGKFRKWKRDSFFLLRSSHPGREKSVLPHKFRRLARVSFGKSRKSFQLALTR